MTLLARRPPLPEPAEFRVPVPDVEPVPTDGGGGTMLDAPSEEPGYFPEDDPVPPEDAFVPVTEGGGGMTFDGA